MKRFWAIICILFSQTTLANEISIAVCQTDEHYQFSIMGEVESWSIENATSYDLGNMTATGDGVKFTVYFGGTSLSIYGYPDVPFCAIPDGWKPSAPSILIPAQEGAFKLEISDVYEHWSLVTDADHPDGIILESHNGFVELIGSVGQDVDPAHYRLIKVAS